jgi:hypothetical protein
VTEIAHDAEATPRALPAMTLLMKPSGIQINVNTKWAFVQPLLHFGAAEIEARAHILSFE